MYFWNIEALKRDIGKGQFTSRAVFPYVVVSAALYAISIEFFNYFPYEDSNQWTYSVSVINALIPIVGTIYTYSSNGGATGKDFAAKYFGIGFVVGIRFIVYLVPILGLLFVYWVYVFGSVENYPTTFLEMVMFSALYAALYLRIAKHMRDTAKV